MLDESEALQRILEKVEPGAVTWVPIELALDQVLAQDMIGVVDSPPFDNSSMDGYAVRAEEAGIGKSLEVALSEQAAGVDLRLRLNPGEAIRIFTGAPIPEGADAVIMQVIGITHANRDFLQPIQHVKLGQAKARQRVDIHGRAQRHGVEPAATSRAPGRGAEFVSPLRQS